MNNLFQMGHFTLHSGEVATWKIECDALLEEDWETLAHIAAAALPPFGAVAGVPTGGYAFANALCPYCVPGCNALLIADDVLTTGRSMEQLRDAFTTHGVETIGVVVFARGDCPEWIYPIFRMGAR